MKISDYKQVIFEIIFILLTAGVSYVTLTERIEWDKQQTKPRQNDIHMVDLDDKHGLSMKNCNLPLEYSQDEHPYFGHVSIDYCEDGLSPIEQAYQVNYFIKLDKHARLTAISKGYGAIIGAEFKVYRRYAYFTELDLSVLNPHLMDYEWDEEWDEEEKTHTCDYTYPNGTEYQIHKVPKRIKFDTLNFKKKLRTRVEHILTGKNACLAYAVFEGFAGR